jgi:hypothetical protein
LYYACFGSGVRMEPSTNTNRPSLWMIRPIDSISKMTTISPLPLSPSISQTKCKEIMIEHYHTNLTSLTNFQ